MSGWQLRVPHRSRDDSLIDVASHCRGLKDGGTMREVVLKAQLDGMRTAGDLISHVEAMTPAERRTVLNKARAEVGLGPVETIDAREPTLTLPTAPATPTTKLVRREDGSYREEPLRPARWARSESGGFIDLNEVEAEAARVQALEESAEQERRDREETRAAEVERQRAHEAAQREQLRTELPEHLQGTVA